MSIRVNEASGVITLQTKNSTYQMKADEYGTLLHLYYGPKIDEEDLSYEILRRNRGLSGNPHEAGLIDRSYSLDTLPQEMSTFGMGDFRITALQTRSALGNQTLRLKYVSAEVQDGKYSIPELPASYDEGGSAKTLVVTMEDAEAETRVYLYYGVFEESDVITRAVKVENYGEQPIVLEKAGVMNLDFQFGDYDMMVFYGKWAKERQPERKQISHGMVSIGSVRGSSSAHYNPSAIICERDATETTGNAYGLAFVYSGEFLLEAERDAVDQTRVTLAIHPDNFAWRLNHGESFMTPEVIMTASDTGFSGVSVHFHEFIREHIVRGYWKKIRRPILINNWEATTFNFNGEKLIEIAESASKLGIEMFVMDDGWFGKRNDDNSGLGDWYVNEQKLGMTMTELGLNIMSCNMRFGIWFEPEMVNEDSDLFREHPDWAITVPGREPNLSRNQLVLDFSRTDVQDNIIEQMTKVLSSANFTYLKWDFNRNLCDLYSHALPADRQGEVAHRFVMGTYRVLETLLTRFPKLLIEGCSSGGGRFDCGMMYYTPQIWCSDNTDAIERLAIQYGTSFIYPASTMGAHVSAVPNEQVGRITPMHTRSTVAMTGTFGYELDVSILSDVEKAQIQVDCELQKKYWDVFQQGDYYRLNTPDADMATVWEQVDRNGKRAIVSAVYHKCKANASPVHVRLQGLNKHADYRIHFAEGHGVRRPHGVTEGLMDALEGRRTVKGGSLMQAGLTIPMYEEDYDSFMLIIEQV